MKFYKLVEHTKQYFVRGQIGGAKKEKLIGEHDHVVGHFADVSDAIAVGEELALIMNPSRVIENNDGVIYVNEHHHFRMDYELEVEVVDLDVTTENMPTLVSKETILGVNDYATVLGMRNFQDAKYPKVRYHNHNNRVYLYAHEKDQEPVAVLEDAPASSENEKE